MTEAKKYLPKIIKTYRHLLEVGTTFQESKIAINEKMERLGVPEIERDQLLNQACRGVS